MKRDFFDRIDRITSDKSNSFFSPIRSILPVAFRLFILSNVFYQFVILEMY